MIRVGVIGVGQMGKHHVRVYSELPNVELVAIADINKNLVYSVAKKYNTKPFVNYKELLKQDLDAVSIAVPTSLHKKVVVDVANSGINILVEKPIADTIKNAKEIIKVCKKNNIQLMIGHIERFNPIIPVIKKRIENDHVISINIMRVGPLPPRIKDVGVIIDLAIHDIDLIRYLTNSEFKKVYTVASKNLSEHEDSAILSFEMENGISAEIITNWITPFKVREINIATREKFVRGWFIEQKVIEYYKYGGNNSFMTKESSVPFGEPLKLELKAFLDCIKKDEQPIINGHDGLDALKIAVKCLNISKKLQ